jgi:hypothetical protein
MNASHVLHQFLLIHRVSNYIWKFSIENGVLMCNEERGAFGI